MPYDATDFDPVVYLAPVPSIADCLRVLKVIADLPRDRFDMALTLPTCDTAGCIIGWTVETLGTGAASETWGFESIRNPLFYPPSDQLMSTGDSGYTATPEQAVAVAEHYLRTGIVNWGLV